MLSREQASALLEELRSDRRFWASQRKQFSRVWAALVEGLSQETRPLEVILGITTSGRLLDALEQMDEQPGAVNAVLRSEVVEKMLGVPSCISLASRPAPTPLTLTARVLLFVGSPRVRSSVPPPDRSRALRGHLRVRAARLLPRQHHQRPADHRPAARAVHERGARAAHDDPGRPARQIPRRVQRVRSRGARGPGAGLRQGAAN